ncbi:hypothetical protein ACFXHA_45205 [Nocardia sp. NPDC059240]|uniref:hypothetical protein n=1 Tax=Nocardia sp. NPDC059240 TaxID=3346786 RepID=UPI003688FF6E
MADNTIRLNRAAVAKLLKSPEIAAQINAAAHRIAAAAGDDAEVDEYTTDRNAAAVKVGAERQAAEGALTRAAASVGLEVRAKA